ncbi:diphthine synthase [Candidatus Nitrososphaera evergladensis SR1]|jgi:diphthine synthase|uniref:Diphthine synthase n=1 Tax=Candidatus Nitrososphaera evergladensis SR1 TaxID=1459636 RepID=A0A075MR07_9ARCH|nr:diphthine synthase [Candidatus Nitrososphaera evergladensis]AIF83643.1 diphthine synthase [Candidatus Nitrososphaera evergladensis SR1]
MLWLVGAGISGHRGLSLEAVQVLKKCDIVFVERFTSALSDSDLEGINAAIGKSAKPVQRWFVEDGREMLDAAKEKQVALVAYGDPLLATTHTELRARAAKASIETGVLHAASGITAIMGECGLHMYKFGRTVTMMSEPKSAVSVYNTVFDNLLLGSHTLILTEYSHDEKTGEPFFLDPTAVLKMLLDCERDLRHHVFSEETFVVVASRLGSSDSRIVSGRIKSLAGVGFGAGPHSVIVPAGLHFTEEEALEALTVCLDSPADNAASVKRISSQMIERYAPKAKEAVRHMRDILRKEGAKEKENNKGMHEVLDNAEYYIDDAERFLRQGKHELAVLSIGYAEGLLDALRFQKGINPWNP